ncbi:nicotinate (nicotinamide) nucleotide adenylyltransferase [Campylobacter pinnipediorum subsp. caledonicus]|uniref:nicotinate (nicotinamide) nucleotide adenylyltransferase n=1 Tax=Campylobacter pinnipediorum TaxID=1965231 RepID=UPI0009957728|nr:nicotinate (nicotinamide) nucleotide adenylyltransferase [Campylobacter pinnipediorum]OPA72345.1 nicotinate (nicotinamide) nucleotide adenylyltransferase [Campylobacter pinnipediorum subsp. caledonicus]
MNLALFGGSFDPPHMGHDSIVKIALNELNIDKLVIMPTFISPFKANFSAPPDVRLKWVKDIWGSLENVEISDFEIEQKRPVPTIQTAIYLKEKYNPENFYLLLGADHIRNLSTWHNYNELKNIVKFIVAKRDEIEIPKNLQKINTDVHISSSEIREGIGYELLNDNIKEDIIKFYKGK